MHWGCLFCVLCGICIGRRGGFYIRPLGTRTCRGVEDAAPYTSYMGDVGANIVRPCSLAVTQDSTGAYRMLPYTQLKKAPLEGSSRDSG